MERQFPPGIQAGLPTSPQVPVFTDGDFSFSETSIETLRDLDVCVPYYKGKMLTPMEISTGIPLVFLSDLSGDVNWHHSYYRANSFRNAKLGRAVTRLSRLQPAGVAEHRTLHEEISGTRAAKTEGREYGGILLNLASYVTTCGFGFGESGLYVRELTQVERSMMRRPGMIRTQPEHDRQRCLKSGYPISREARDDQHRITSYLLNHAFTRTLEDVSEDTVAKFLSITEKDILNNDLLRQTKYDLGIKLANKAIGIAVDPFTKEFKRARTGNALSNNAPKSAWHVVKNQIRSFEPQFFPVLEQSLRQQFGVAA
jgi:hypothetical protein